MEPRRAESLAPGFVVFLLGGVLSAVVELASASALLLALTGISYPFTLPQAHMASMDFGHWPTALARAPMVRLMREAACLAAR